ncbi:Mdm33 family-domain-containing protein [Biscogniauxia mediterranea]|nr:Mdm33 family-domain-containing protein [Biscogniauxia mediterranea]
MQPNFDLPSALNSRRSALNQTLSSFMDRAQATLFSASRRLNDLTGYSGIETLKSQISSLEASLSEAQERLHASRNKYKSSVATRSSTQREITTLLARQKTWTPTDFERFTELYRSDYELDAGVAQAAQELEEAEREAEQLSRELSAGILSRYHEEQIWSDKIRRMSTWGTWGLMGVNILLFLVLQFGAEPWRRQRLVRGFEDKVREALADEWAKERAAKAKERESDREWAEAMNLRMNAAAAAPAAVAAVGSEQAGVDAAAPEPLPAREPVFEKPPIEPPISPLAGATWREVLTDAGWWKDTFSELSSEKRVAVRMRDMSILALEGVAAGVTIASAVAAVFLLRRS